MVVKKSDKIVITGDIVLDWMIATQEPAHHLRDWWDLPNASFSGHAGGVVQLADLVDALLVKMPDKDDMSLVRMYPNLGEPVPGDHRHHHVYSLLALFAYGLRSAADKQRQAWRIEKNLGFESRKTANQAHDEGRGNLPVDQARLTIIDDLGLDFRHQEASWPKSLLDGQGWTVVKVSQPIAVGPLWEALKTKGDKRLLLITTAQDLRKTAIQVSQRISWERTAQDVVWELTYNPAVNALTHLATLVVSFGCSGAILINPRELGGHAARLFFDPGYQEEEWESAYPGGMLGYTNCLTAGLVYQIIKNEHQPDFLSGIQAGIAAARFLHREGYGGCDGRVGGDDFCIDYQGLADEIITSPQPLSMIKIQDPTAMLGVNVSSDTQALRRGYWTILEDHYIEKLEAVAREIVIEGSQTALRHVPVSRFGAKLTVDRHEIEALNGIQRLIAEYSRTAQKKPLSIAVFGPPGSGKSFGVTQVAKSVLGNISILSFNLSQFRHPDGLYDALHQVRDVNLSGKIPLVFWDEFDTSLENQRLGWLRYFLSPMQDGAFQQGQVVHPIGQCIFVFAGGSSHRMDLFGSDLSESEQRAAKLPDFVSRLKGYLNITGPDPVGGKDQDPYFIIRRALILRSIIEYSAPQIIKQENGSTKVQIDEGLLYAFLATNQYRHGVRSMESLISMSTLTGKKSYDRSSLPPEEQLDLHVVAAEFLALMQKLELKGDILEQLAEAVHDLFCEEMISKGYQYGTVTDERAKTHSSLLPYAQLPEDEKEQNRQNVIDIPEKLIIARYVMRPARSNEPPFEFPGDDLEKLAEREHHRWMQSKFQSGWRYAPETDKAQKLHQALVVWEVLPETEKEKDRHIVRAIPYILARAGYAVERVRK